jgi:hypothetical protein
MGAKGGRDLILEYAWAWMESAERAIVHASSTLAEGAQCLERACVK